MKTATIKEGRGELCALCSCRRDVTGVGRVTYIIEEEKGESRAAYGTPCERFYTLVIRTDSDECRLPDVAREREEAIALCMRFASGAVLPTGATEVLEELLYT